MKQIAQIIALILPGQNTFQVLVTLAVLILMLQQIAAKNAENIKVGYKRTSNRPFDQDMWAIE